KQVCCVASCVVLPRVLHITLMMEKDNKRDHEESDSSSPEKFMRMEDTTHAINNNVCKVNTLAQFQSETGETAGPPIELPLSLARDKLQQILNTLLEQEEQTPYSFFVNEKEVTGSLNGVIDSSTSEEKVMVILYQPQAVFRVRAITRCTSSLAGHAEAVLSASFSPDGQHLASGSGDTTVRFWDINTETPHFTCKGHRHWVLVTAWSPDSVCLASGCKAGQIFIWDPKTGKQVLSNHLQCVTALRWSGEDLLYSASQDRTIKVWRASDGTMCRTLQGHGHWVNTLALNTDYALRTGAFDPEALMKDRPEITSADKRQAHAEKCYKEALAAAGGVERLASGSDDFTLFLWEPARNKKPIERMTGHQQLVNDVKFSPDTRIIASASFDKSIRLWSGLNGKFLGVLRGHVCGVYQVAWSADSRLLVSGSKDSTLKVWNMSTKKIEIDLPGHADEVFTVDWSPDGQRVVSGGKDKILKIWRR
ncbi:hypothetical protein OTU49_002514, partial [Cherax quadricarinatus]